MRPSLPTRPTRLNALSAAFLSAEDVEPESSLVIGSFATLRGPAPSVEEVRELVASRLHLAPRYRQRVVSSPLHLRAPSWREDPDFVLRRHVRHTTVRHPGGDTEVSELIGAVMSARMDRSHPLWDITVVDGLPDGRWALLCRVHHALADGVSGTALLRVLYDSTEEAAPPRVGLPQHGGSGLQHAVATAAAAGRGGLALGSAVVPVHGPSVTGEVTSGRHRYAWTTVPLHAVHTVREAHGATVNDVALATVTAAFRELLVHRGLEPHARAVRSLVPVSAWTGSTDDPDNRVTLMLADLPVHLEQPTARLQAVHETVHRLRDAGEPVAGVVAQRVAGLLPYPLVEAATKVALALPHHHVSTVTTNVPGPRQPLTCLGREVEDLLPYVPIADRVRIAVAMFTYAGRLTFGVTADHDVDDLDVLVGAIDAAWWELAGQGSKVGR
jgi:diacylglycerol O-acyltransferase